MALAIIRLMKLSTTAKKPWTPRIHPSATLAQQHWLNRPGALTAGLRRLGHVELRVVREYAHRLDAQEAALISKPPGTLAWIREVAMSIDGVCCVIARSFTPLAASHGVWQGIRRLRSRPLADMLYNDAQIQRSEFLSCRLNRAMPLWRTVQHALCTHNTDSLPMPANLMARCSVFWRCGEPLLVAECFTPAFWTPGATLS